MCNREDTLAHIFALPLLQALGFASCLQACKANGQAMYANLANLVINPKSLGGYVALDKVVCC